MSAGVNKIILLGNLGRDPELSCLPSGMAICKLSLATTEGWKKDDGTWEDLTEWHRVVVWGKTGEHLQQNATKGSQIYIEGRIHYDSYEKDGVKRYTTDIIAKVVRICGGKAGEGHYTPPEDKPSSTTQPQDDPDPDLPF